MSAPCPHPDEWLRLLDGELTENRGAALRAHAEGCVPCAAALREVEAILGRLAGPVEGVPSAPAVATLMARLDAPRPDRAPRPRGRWWGAAAGLAAAAAVALVVLRPPPDRGEFTPRGEAGGWAAGVGVELWTLEREPRRLAAGSVLAPGTPVVATATGGAGGPAYLLAFAVDARGELHWLYPAWLDARTDPPSVRVEPGAARRPLSDGPLLDEVPPGPGRLVTILTRAPLTVSAVERLPPAGREAAALRARWPEARVEVLPVRFERLPGTPGGAP